MCDEERTIEQIVKDVVDGVWVKGDVQRLAAHAGIRNWDDALKVLQADSLSAQQPSGEGMSEFDEKMQILVRYTRQSWRPMTSDEQGALGSVLRIAKGAHARVAELEVVQKYLDGLPPLSDICDDCTAELSVRMTEVERERDEALGRVAELEAERAELVDRRLAWEKNARASAESYSKAEARTTELEEDRDAWRHLAKEAMPLVSASTLSVGLCAAWVDEFYRLSGESLHKPFAGPETKP